MAEIEVDFGQGMVEKWQDWIMPGGKDEYDSLPDALKPRIRSLARRPLQLTPPDKLVEYYDDIDKLAEDPSSGVTYADIGNYLDRITKRIEQVSEETRAGKQAALRELPLHIGAVFKNGRNWLLVEHPSIPILDVKNRNHRLAYILENIHAFDNLFGQASAWKGAEDIWIADSMIAAQAEHLSDRERDDFLKILKAMMGVTGQARAMEASAGNSVAYLTTLTDGEHGNLDTQDLWQDYLVHGDPEKLNVLLENPLIKHYYDKLINDAGLRNDSSLEWHEIPDPDKPGKTIWVSSSVVLRDRPEVIRNNNQLIKYLKGYAEEGGFDSYIENVLLKLDSPKAIAELHKRGIEKDSRWAAAKLACDLFLIDKWTRWEDLITNKTNSGGGITGKLDESLDLQPKGTWGGDPLKAILQPSFLQRLKKVYMGKDAVILDLMDKAFRPDDILKGDLERYMMVPSLAINMKKYARYMNSIQNFIGGSMGDGIPLWDNKTMGESLPQIASLLTQVYGTVKVRGYGEAGKEIGKHIVGAMMMRVIFTKALAAASESSKPGFGDKINIIFGSGARDRPFLSVMQFLYGPKFDSKSGFIRGLVSNRTRLVVGGNVFDAEKFYKEAWEVLQTNDQSSGRRQAAALNALGVAFDLFSSIGENIRK